MQRLCYINNKEGTMDEKEIREENRRVRFLRMLVDLSVAAIQGGDLSLEQARKMVAELRQAACNLFPGKEETFDLIYQPRFNRAIHERFGFTLSDPGIDVFTYMKTDS
jgi:hypothetical protein